MNMEIIYPFKEKYYDKDDFFTVYQAPFLYY